MATEVTKTAKLEISGIEKVGRKKAEPGSFSQLISVMKRIQNALDSLNADDRAVVLNFFRDKNRLNPPF